VKKTTESVHVQVRCYFFFVSDLHLFSHFTAQMDTFQSPDSHYLTEYDATGKVIHGEDDNYDAEAQVIRDEFKHPPY
jgi:hypothetical protein